MKTKNYFLMLIFICSSLFAQTGISKTDLSTPSNVTSVERVYVYSDDQFQYEEYHGGSYNVGNYTYSPNTQYRYDYVYRTAYKFTIPSLPSNAINIVYYLIPSADGSGSQGTIVSVSDGLNFNYLTGVFSAVGSGSGLFNFNYGDGITPYNITSFVNSKLSQGYFNIGAIADSEPRIDVSLILRVDYTIPVEITAANNFGSGTINIDGQTQSSGTKFYKWIGQSAQPGAIEQSDGTNNRIWNDTEAPANLSVWKQLPSSGGSSDKSYSQNYSFSVASNDHQSTYEAGLRKVCNITFQNSSGAGTITVNGNNYSSPATGFQVVELNNITGTAVYHVVNGIEYIFTQWSDGSTQSYNHTFTPSSNQTYTANFTGRPNNSYRNLSIPSAVGQPITLDWDEHPNTAVTQYAIYRKVKHNGVMGSEQLIGTRSRGTTMYWFSGKRNFELIK